MQVNGNTVAPAQYLDNLRKIDRLSSNFSHTSPGAYVTMHDSYLQESESYHDEPDIDKLVAALIAANVIHHKTELLSFKLSDTEFIMNDIRMPEAIHLLLKKEFVPTLSNGNKRSWAWMYNFKT